MHRRSIALAVEHGNLLGRRLALKPKKLHFLADEVSAADIHGQIVPVCSL